MPDLATVTYKYPNQIVDTSYDVLPNTIYFILCSQTLKYNSKDALIWSQCDRNTGRLRAI